jgi:hypothetical protein
MRKVLIIINWLLIFVGCAFVFMSASDSSAAITPIGPYQAEVLADPDPTVFTFQSSIAYYNNLLIYAGNDGKIYAYDIDTGISTLVSDTSSLSTLFSAVQGFVVSSDNYLYFHDNAVTSNIYRLKLTGAWPVAYETLDTGITSAIFAFTENPWTNTIWFSSSDFFGSGNQFYLYEIDAAFATTTLRTSFVQPNSGGSGPIIFKGPSTVLYGESVFGGNGFFHLINSSTGELIRENYLTFTAGLGDSTYGYNNRIYVTSGGGKMIYEIRGSSTPFALGTTDDEARGITFGNAAFFVDEMLPFSGGADDGKISLNKSWDPNPVIEISPVDPFRSRAVADPSPEVFVYQSSIAYYNNYLIYAGDDGKIYGYNLDSSESVVISDTSSLATAFSSVQGFTVSSDKYLYFHDNAVTSNIYRVLLTETWPAQFETLDTQVSSAIFAFTENPWTNTIWFSSSDFFGAGNNFYLYAINSEFTGVTLNLSFEQPNGGGNGPIIFENETTVLYGESVFGGNGYFHQVNTDTGAVIQENYLTFSGGIGDATAGYNNRIYVTSGGGKAIFEIDGIQKTQLATTHDEARGITFDGTSFFISAMVPFSGSADDGEISLLQLWQTRLSGRAEIIGIWSNGIWYRDVAASKWTQMSADTPTGDIAAGDFTGDGKADVASIWASGLWYQDGATLAWTKVGSAPSSVTAGDVTGDGRFEIIGAWSDGIWYWDVVAAKWTKMTASTPTGDLSAGDFTGDGKADVASIWASGLWYQDGATLDWTKVSGTAPVSVTAGDVTGDGRFEIIGAWSDGIWYWDVVAAKWTKMTASTPTGDIAAGDFTGDGRADVASIWASGLWYQDGDTLAWTKVVSAPNRVTAGDVTGQ